MRNLSEIDDDGRLVERGAALVVVPRFRTVPLPYPGVGGVSSRGRFFIYGQIYIDGSIDRSI